MSFSPRRTASSSSVHSRLASGRRSPKRVLKQASLFDLAGVIGLGRLEKHHRVLRDPKVDTEEGIRILRELGSKRPATQIIIDTGIGKTIRKLSASKSADPRLAAEARTVYKAWKAAIERRVTLEERGPVEVLCDLPTTTRRTKCKDLLREALKSTNSLDLAATSFAEDIVGKIEKELFDQCNHLVRDEYRRRTRKLYFGLRHDAAVRDALLVTRTLSIKRLVLDQQ